MKFFVTGRSTDVLLVDVAYERIKEAGHQVILEWTKLPMLKPYNENAVAASQFAYDRIDEIIQSDVYILLAHEDGNGVFTELGAALALHQLHGKPQVYAVAEKMPQTMFHYHPAIKWRTSVDEVLAEVYIQHPVS